MNQQAIRSYDYALEQLIDVSDTTSLTADKTLRVNLPPIFVDGFDGRVPELIATIGLTLNAKLPEFHDYEGDSVEITIDDTNRLGTGLGLHAQDKGNDEYAI